MRIRNTDKKYVNYYLITAVSYKQTLGTVGEFILIYAKSYMRKWFLIYVEMHKYFTHILYSMRRPLVIYDFAPDFSKFPYTVYEENFLLFFISVYSFSYIIYENNLYTKSTVKGGCIIEKTSRLS
jgi:hypothetical protein